MEGGLFSSYTLKLTNYLGHKGFDIVDVKPDEYNPHYKVFMFKDSTELRRAVDEFRKIKYEQRGKKMT